MSTLSHTHMHTYLHTYTHALEAHTHTCMCPRKNGSIKCDVFLHNVQMKSLLYCVCSGVCVDAGRELNLDPHIMMIEKFNTDESGARMIKGFYFYRPNETYHLATRKFLEKVHPFFFLFKNISPFVVLFHEYWASHG